MRHLTLDALARLVDDAPDADEREHLRTCDACREELEALRSQTDALGTLPRIMPGPDAWPELSRRLEAEGLIRSRRPSWRRPGLVRLAAALALFLTGGATGFLVRGPVDRSEAVRVAAETTRPPQVDRADAIEGAPVDSGEAFAAALDRFMEETADPVGGGQAPDPAARLAALDNIVLTTAEALNEAPGDPVLNSYHLTALAQRQALLRQLSASRGEPVF